MTGYIKSQFTASEGIGFIVMKGPKKAVEYIKEKEPDVEYLDYDWTLNSQIPPKKQ